MYEVVIEISTAPHIVPAFAYAIADTKTCINLLSALAVSRSTLLVVNSSIVFKSR